MTAPTSRQLHLALGLIEPKWGSTNWPILGLIAYETIDYRGRDAFIELPERTIEIRTGISRNTVSKRMAKLVAQGVVEVDDYAGRRARTIRIAGAFERWDVPWRIDRSKALFVLREAVLAHVMGRPQRWISGATFGAPQPDGEPAPDLPVYRITGDFVPHHRLLHNDDDSGAPWVAPQPPPPVNAFGFSSPSETQTSIPAKEEEVRTHLTDDQAAVVQAVKEVTGQPRIFGDALNDICAAVDQVEGCGPAVAGVIRRERPPRWRDAVALAVRATFALRDSRARAASPPREEVPPEEVVDQAEQLERFKRLRSGVRQNGGVTPTQEAGAL